MTECRRRAVVIGAGLGGLALALRLACRGWAVTICEQASSPGGKMNRWETNGFRFDTGPSLITMPWVFEELFAAAGTRLCDHIELLNVHPLAEYRFADGTRFTHTADLPAWLDTVRRLENGEASGFLRFMELGSRLFDISRATFFKQSPFEFRSPPPAGALRRLPGFRAWDRYERTVRHYFRSPHLRQMFNRYTTYVGSSPWRTPATLSVIPYLEYAFGGWHVRGGLYQLVEAISELGRRNGVELRVGARVIRIERQAGRASGVELEGGERLPAEAVILNGDASTAPRLLDERSAPPPIGFTLAFRACVPFRAQDHTARLAPPQRSLLRRLCPGVPPVIR